MANPSDQEKTLYPLSTEDHTSIPLDVIRPLACLLAPISAIGSTSVTIPVGWRIGAIYASAACFIQFNAVTLGTPPAANTPYSDTLFVPAGAMMTSTLLEGAARIVSAESEAGFLTITHVQKWAAIALARQLSRN